jgi:hypothetical protein
VEAVAEVLREARCLLGDQRLVVREVRVAAQAAEQILELQDQRLVFLVD